MTIGELSAVSLTPASTIRYWERIGVLPKAVRVHGQRRYAEDAVERLAVLRLAQACGFRLEEMRQLLHGFEAQVRPPRRWQDLALRKKAEIDEQMMRLRTMRRLVDRVLQCNCAELAACGQIAARVRGSTR